MNNSNNGNNIGGPSNMSVVEDGINYFAKGRFKEALSFFIEKLKSCSRPVPKHKSNIKYYKLIWWIIRIRIELGLHDMCSSDL